MHDNAASSEIVDLLVRPVEIRLGKRVWPVRITHRTILQFEQSAGVSVLDDGFSPGAMSAGQTRALLAVLFRQRDGSVTDESVGRWLNLRNLGPTRGKLLEAWRESMPDVADERDEHEDKREERKSVDPSARSSWMKLWSIAREHLGLGSSEWLDMTPRMVQELGRRRLEALQDLEMIGAVIASTTANFSYAPPKRPVSPEKFMVHPFRQKNGSDGRSDGRSNGGAMTGDDIAAMLGQYSKMSAQANGQTSGITDDKSSVPM